MRRKLLTLVALFVGILGLLVASTPTSRGQPNPPPLLDFYCDVKVPCHCIAPVEDHCCPMTSTFSPYACRPAVGQKCQNFVGGKQYTVTCSGTIFSGTTCKVGVSECTGTGTNTGMNCMQEVPSCIAPLN